MKEGTNTGKLDSLFTNIKVGDHLIPAKKETGLMPGVVDNYGSLVTEKGKISPKDWDGIDYIVGEYETLKPADTPPIQEVKADNREEIEKLKAEAEFWKNKFDEITIADFNAQSLVDELRCRGYEVTCKRIIVEEL